MIIFNINMKVNKLSMLIEIFIIFNGIMSNVFKKYIGRLIII